MKTRIARFGLLGVGFVWLLAAGTPLEAGRAPAALTRTPTASSMGS